MAPRRQAMHNRTAGTITMPAWIVFDRDGILRTTVSEPATKAAERKMRIELTVPESIFKEPVLSAKIVVEGESGTKTQIAAIHRVQEAIRGIPEAELQIVTTRDGR